MKKWILIIAIAFIGLAAASYNSDVSAYETVTVTESYGSTGSTVTTYASSGTAFVQRRPIRNTLRAGRNVLRGTVRAATAPIRTVGSCR